MTQAQMTNVNEIQTFMMAGNSTFTIVSKVTGQRFTYRLRAPQTDGRFDYTSTRRFVSVLTGSDNNADYSYIGCTIRGNGFAYGTKAKIVRDAVSVRTFEWFYSIIQSGRMPSNVEFWHEGRCGRCNRKLTVPSSIANGLGPECSGRFLAEAA